MLKKPVATLVLIYLIASMALPVVSTASMADQCIGSQPGSCCCLTSETDSCEMGSMNCSAMPILPLVNALVHKLSVDDPMASSNLQVVEPLILPLDFQIAPVIFCDSDPPKSCPLPLLI